MSVALLEKPRPSTLHFPILPTFIFPFQRVNILSGFEPFTILLENVIKLCYSFPWQSMDHISKCRGLDPANPVRFNSVVISSVYDVFPFVSLKTTRELR